jgi:STE24 endopeptidase
VNETKSARYHRTRRQAAAISLAWGVVLPLMAIYMRPSPPLWLYVIGLAIVHEAVALPVAWYRTFVLERRYELSTEPFATWLKDHFKAFGIATVFALVAAEAVYLLMVWRPLDWWLWAAVGATAVTIILARLAPVILLPLFYTFTPLERPNLVARLVSLSKRAGVPVLGVFEWGLGAKTRRANAALVGSGATRRILLSDTLLADYTDDEIEVILAHELGHHVHRDIPKGLLMEFLVLLGSFGAAAAVLNAAWQPLGLATPSDVAGLPLLILVVGAVSVAATPLLHALSRLNERRADEFALDLTDHREPFISAMKRLGSQNLSEENPSRLAVILYHTHPPIEERIRRASGAT